MPYPVPENPQWPDKDDAEYPLTRRVKRIDLSDSTWERIQSWLTETPQFVVVEDWYVYSEYLDKWIFVPKNFVYDYASTKALGFILRPTGVLALGSLPHDFGFRFGGLMVSDAPGEPYYFQEYNQKEIDKVIEEYSDRVSGLDFIGDIVRWGLGIFARWRPIPMDYIDWDYLVMPRKFYEDNGMPKFPERDDR